VLSVLDRKWREHLYEMDYLREGIGLRGYGQRDPLIEYQREGYDMFSAMMDGIKEESVGNLFNLVVQVQENPIVEEGGAAAGGVLAAAPPVEAPGASGAAGAAGAAGPTGRHGVPAQGTGQPPARAGAPASGAPASGAPGSGAPASGGAPARGGAAPAQAGAAAAAAGSGQGRAAAAKRDGRVSGAQTGAAAKARAGGAHARPAGAPATPAAPPVPAGLVPRRPQRLQYSAPSVDGGTHVETSQGPGADDDFARVGRNDPCPCGSGRKFKRCHGDPRMRPDA
jgi:preprotein translocase subunit SecA